MRDLYTKKHTFSSFILIMVLPFSTLRCSKDDSESVIIPDTLVIKTTPQTKDTIVEKNIHPKYHIPKKQRSLTGGTFTITMQIPRQL